MLLLALVTFNLTVASANSTHVGVCTYPPLHDDYTDHDPFHGTLLPQEGLSLLMAFAVITTALRPAVAAASEIAAVNLDTAGATLPIVVPGASPATEPVVSNPP